MTVTNLAAIFFSVITSSLFSFFFKRCYYREKKKTRRETKRKERIDLSRQRPVRGHGYMKECGWLFYVFYFYVERKRNRNSSQKISSE
jgi:Na+/melibiose symporter-like transporter